MSQKGIPLLLAMRSELPLTLGIISQLPGPVPGTDTKAGCCLLPPNMGLLLKGDPSAFSSGFYCTKRAEQHSNSDCTLPSSSPTLLYALGAISAGKRQALASKQFVVLKFGHFWPMFRKREAPSTGRTMDRAAPF